MLSAAKAQYSRVKKIARKWRKPIVAIALIALLTGLAWSISQLGLHISDLQFWPLLLAFAATVPASIFLNAMEFRLCGDVLGKPMSWRFALTVTLAGTVANILPVPASLAIRGKALCDHSGEIISSGKILALAAVMWVAAALIATGLSLPFGLVSSGIAGGGLFALFVAFLLVSKLSSIGMGFEFILVRAAMMAVIILRLMLLFAAIGMAVSIADAGILSGVGVVSAVVAVIPSGIGLTEGSGALLAMARDLSPAAAFIVLTLDRALGLVGNSAAFAATQFWDRPDAVGTEAG